MAIPKPEALPALVNANDKLLKALVTLLALKDEHLLEELRIVFSAAIQNGNAIGEGDAPTWAHLRKELALISDLVDDMERND
jgi:hypothetical protein